MDSPLIADYFIPVEYEDTIIKFNCEEKLKKLKIEFVNDYYVPQKDLDRNLKIKSISFIKK